VSNFPFPVSADARISLFLSLILGSAAFLSSFFYLSLRRAIGPVMLSGALGEPMPPTNLLRLLLLLSVTSQGRP
jgi:hypothetical protein